MRCENNAQSIRDIPPEQLPDAEARAELVRRAEAGADVYAYRPVGCVEWVVWARQAHPSIEARFEPAEWARQWREGLQPLWPAQRGEGGVA